MEFRHLHVLRRIVVRREPRDDEEHVAVPLELGPLPGLEEILDEQRVQVPPAAEVCDLLDRGDVVAEDDEPVRLGLRERERGVRGVVGRVGADGLRFEDLTVPQPRHPQGRRHRDVVTPLAPSDEIEEATRAIAAGGARGHAHS